MNGLVFPVAVVGTVATGLMILAMLYFTWLAMDDDAHGPTPDTDDAKPPEVADDAGTPEITDDDATAEVAEGDAV